MAQSVFKSEQGRQAIAACYENVLSKAGSRFPFRRRVVETAIAKTHLIEAGPADGPPLLLLHGTASNSAMWSADIPVWARHFRVIAADIPGEPGLSEDRRLTLASDEGSQWLASLLDELALSAVRIVGMSLGGWMCLRFATRHPKRVQALSLISASGFARPKMSFLVVALPLTLLGDWGLKRINRIVCGKIAIHPDVEEFMILVGRHFRPMLEPVPVFGDEELTRLTMPIQFLAGKQDALLPAEASARRLTKLLPHAEVCVFPECGHAVIGKADEILEFQLRSRQLDPRPQ